MQTHRQYHKLQNPIFASYLLSIGFRLSQLSWAFSWKLPFYKTSWNCLQHCGKVFSLIIWALHIPLSHFPLIHTVRKIMNTCALRSFKCGLILNAFLVRPSFCYSSHKWQKAANFPLHTIFDSSLSYTQCVFFFPSFYNWFQEYKFGSILYRKIVFIIVYIILASVV